MWPDLRLSAAVCDSEFPSPVWNPHCEGIGKAPEGRRTLRGSFPAARLREWSRTRRVPLSTARKAAQSGRVTREADGRLGPARADREWYENMRPRVDLRHPEVPTDPTRAVTELPPRSRQESEERYGAPAPDPSLSLALPQHRHPRRAHFRALGEPHQIQPRHELPARAKVKAVLPSTDLS